MYLNPQGFSKKCNVFNYHDWEISESLSFLLKLQILLFKLCFVTKIDLLLELMGDSYTHAIIVGGIQIQENNISVMLNNNFKIQMVSPSWNFVLRSL